MSIKDTLLKAKENVRARVENVLGLEKGMDPLALRKEILTQVEANIVSEASGRIFPFGNIIIRLQAQTKAQRSAIEEYFLQKDSLNSDVQQMLRAAHVQYPDELEALIEFVENPESDQTEGSCQPPFEMDFIKSDLLHRQEIPETKLVILKGLTEQTEYLIKKDRILVGRGPEVLDREGRMVRKNEIVFLDNGEEINCSVGRAHARIWFNHGNCEFCILDEASRYGTRILRGGAVIEVPSGDPDGIHLQSGDDIYCGQACLRFILI